MKVNLSVILVLIAVSLLTVVLVGNFDGFNFPQKKSLSNSGKILSTQTDDQGEIKVMVTPEVLAVGKEVSFKVSLDTHTQELEFDLTKLSKLMDDKGVSYQALSWTGGAGGHHVSGTLTFPKLNKTTSVRLTIAGVNNIERNFEWQL